MQNTSLFVLLFHQVIYVVFLKVSFYRQGSGTPVAGTLIFLSDFAPSGIDERSVVAETRACPFFSDISVEPPEVRVDIRGISVDLMTMARLSEEVSIMSMGAFS